MRLAFGLRLENTEEGNTWFSDAHTGESDIQLHVTREVWIAMKRPNFVRVTVDPMLREDD